MRCNYACGSSEHTLSRRSFLTGVSAGTAGLLGFNGMIQPAAARELSSQQKRVLVVFLSGGVSQLETWDPKPGTNTGGPFQTISTSVPGVHICELLPHTARMMHRMALVRGIDTAEDDHGKGYTIMHTGRREEPGLTYPHLGAACAKFLAREDNPLPGYIHVTPSGGGGVNAADAAFLGPRFASVALDDGQAPANITRPGDLSPEMDLARHRLRLQASQRFLQRRRTAQTEAYTQSYDQASLLMKQKHLFDSSAEPERLRDRYGRHDFGRHCLMARRLLEGGATFVKVSHTNYDTHHENFDFHIEQLGEFDRPFATLLEDLEVRGLLDSTLVIVMSEFGRTPNINRNYGRDHWSRAWSVALAGCGIKGGAVVGKTNPNGTAVTDRMVNGGHLFHTYFRALGLDPKKNYYIDQRPIPMADPKASAITEILA
ncbi:MAG: DUF1501 domain-containing protein [Gemmataceae bacterium]